MCLIEWADCNVAVSRTTSPKARKPHNCCECGRIIAAGERYEYNFFVQEGHADSFHTCAHCQVGYQWLTDNCGGHMVGGDSLIEEMDEHAREYPALAFGLRLIATAMRERWERFDGAGLVPLPPMPRSIASVVVGVQ